MDYRQALDYIHSAKRFGSRPGLEVITMLLQLMDKPQHSFKSVHVAGTNGKGSTCAYMDSILREAGYKTGLYTSPYLERFTERVRVNGVEIVPEDVAAITSTIKECIDRMVSDGYARPTEFELVTALGFEHFKRQRVEYAVVEVGMGGRLDATNVIIPELCVITSISIDHMDVLGDNIADIAREKAGIIKYRVPVVLYPQQPDALNVIQQACARQQAPLEYVADGRLEGWKADIGGQVFDFRWKNRLYSQMAVGMLGRHQVYNAITAIVAALRLGLSEQDIRNGLAKARWPGRMEVIRKKPVVIIDGAHNAEGAKALVDGLKQFFPGKRVRLVFGILRDKEIEEVGRILAGYSDSVITVRPDSPRSLDPDRLAGIVSRYNKKVEIADTISEAVDRGMHNIADDEIIVFSGSLYLIGEVRRLLPPEIS
jgi:dihydrofolate synthase/folylpolyglutamate synthase